MTIQYKGISSTLTESQLQELNDLREIMSNLGGMHDVVGKWMLNRFHTLHKNSMETIHIYCPYIPLQLFKYTEHR